MSKKENLSNKEISLLLKLYNSQDKDLKINKKVFRAQNEDDIHLLDRLQKSLLKTEYDKTIEYYYINIYSLVFIKDEQKNIRNIFSFSEVIYKYLRAFYVKFTDEELSIDKIINDTNYPFDDVRLSLYYFSSMFFASCPGDMFESKEITIKLSESILKFKTYEEEINNIKNRSLYNFNNQKNITSSFPFISNVIIDKSKIFIVHGQDDELKNEVSSFLKKLDLTPIILHEQANSGKTIIEKIEHYTDVNYAIILYTPCDIGGKTKEGLKARARQNVVFEHGYLMSKIKRENISVLKKGDLEFPNDLAGKVYINATNDSWKFSLIKELKAAKFDIDVNKYFE